MNRAPASLPRHHASAENGMVLLLCLIFLTALTLLGLSASAEAILQNQLAVNLQESERAKQSAMRALSWAERWLLGLDGAPPETCTTACSGLKLHARGDLPTDLESRDPSWWLDHGHEAGIDPLTGERSLVIAGDNIDPPFWTIEVMHELPPTNTGATDLQVWYRILARGSARTGATVSVVESIVVRSWPSAGNRQAPQAANCPAGGPDAKCGRVAWRELR